MSEQFTDEESTFVPPPAEKSTRQRLAESNPRLINDLLPGSERRGSVSSGPGRLSAEEIDGLVTSGGGRRSTATVEPPAPTNDVAVLENAAASATPEVAERLTGIAGEIRVGHIEGLEARRSAIEDALATVDETLLSPEQKASWTEEKDSITAELNRLRPPADEVDGGDYTPEEMATPAAPPAAEPIPDAERQMKEQLQEAQDAVERARALEAERERLDTWITTLTNEELREIRHKVDLYMKLSSQKRHEAWRGMLTAEERHAFVELFSVPTPFVLPDDLFEEE